MSQLPDLPSNSHKSREEREQADKRPDIPEFEGDVAGVKRKENKNKFLKWLRKMFLSDQKPSDIFMSIVENQIVPGIKDSVRNSVVSSIDMFMYQNSKPVSTTNNNISYSKIYSSQTNNTKVQSNQPKITSSSDQSMNEGFTNPCFKRLDDEIRPDGSRVQGAKSFLALMINYDYPTLSVHTLYMMRKQHISYTWDAYGWTKEEIANVKIVHINNPDYPWMIDLPPAHLIA